MEEGKGSKSNIIKGVLKKTGFSPQAPKVIMASYSGSDLISSSVDVKGSGDLDLKKTALRNMSLANNSALIKASREVGDITPHLELQVKDSNDSLSFNSSDNLDDTEPENPMASRDYVG